MVDPSQNVVERLLGVAADFLARHCRVLAIVALVSLIIPGWWLRRIETYNDIETWLLRKSPEYRRYQDFLKTFGSEEYVVLAATMEDPFSAEGLERQKRLAARLEVLDGVDGVLGLPRFAASVWPDRADWREDALGTPFLRNLLLGPDGKTVGVLAWFRQGQAPLDRVRTVDALESVAREESGPGFELHMAGTPLVNVALNRTCVKDLSLFVPLALAASIGVLVFMLRTPALVVAPLLAVASTLLWTLGLMAMTGASLNMVTVTLPPLLTVLVLSNGIHLASRFSDKLAVLGDRQAAARETLRELIRPALLASGTTAVGCGSLMVADMKPVSEMGLFAGIGILIGLLLNLTVVPGVLSTLRWRATPPSRTWTHWSSHTGVAMTRYWWIVVPAAAVLVVVCTVGISRITIKPHVLRFLPKNSLVKRDYTLINERLTGFYSLEVEARTDAAGEDAVLDAMDRMDKMLSDRPDVARTIHIGQIVPYIDRALLVGASEGIDERTTRFLNDIRGRFRQQVGDHVALRQSVIVREYEGINVADLVDATVGEARRQIPPTASVAITGIVPLLKQAELGLVRTQIKSFALAGGISLLAIGLLYRSIRAFVVSTLPNLLPVAGTFALMAVIGIPLDVATVMIASVSISIAVDDTIHFLERFQAGRREGKDVAASTADAFAKAGRAMVFTSVVAAAGFAMLTLSSFVPMANLGLLSAIAMMSALAGDLFVTPAMARMLNLWAQPPEKQGAAPINNV